MRLFHIDMLDVLPRQQLLGQWRELNSIFKKQDKHILINFIYDYPKEHLLLYSNLVLLQFKKNNYKYNLTNYNEYFNGIVSTGNIAKANCFKEKMNDIYLRECIYNLEEKFIAGGISKEEWQKIYDKYKDKFDLWDGE